jgi:hypothetical protein
MFFITLAKHIGNFPLTPSLFPAGGVESIIMYEELRFKFVMVKVEEQEKDTRRVLFLFKNYCFIIRLIFLTHFRMI